MTEEMIGKDRQMEHEDRGLPQHARETAWRKIDKTTEDKRNDDR